MTPLENWIERAASGLSQESAAQVRREIVDHYESAREAAVAAGVAEGAAGATPEAADVSALHSLGDAKTANRQYRRVFLTASEEAYLLSGDNVEARVLATANSWVRWPLLALSMCALAAAAALYRAEALSLARVALAFGIGTGFWLVVPLLPICTPLRGRVFRGIKWLMRAGTVLLAFGTGALNIPLIIVLTLVQLPWTEWKRASIRRKLPTQQWPRQLYL